MPVKQSFQKSYRESQERFLLGLPPANRAEALGRILSKILFRWLRPPKDAPSTTPRTGQ